MFNSIHLAQPGLFIREDIIRYNNDVGTLAQRRLLPPMDLMIASVPCEPFWYANTSNRDPPLKLRDVRELFTVVQSIRNRLVRKHSYTIECTPFAPQMQNALERINE